MSRRKREAAARRRRRMWRDDPTCKLCGCRTNPDGLHRDRPKLGMVDGAEAIVCRGCLTG